VAVAFARFTLATMADGIERIVAYARLLGSSITWNISDVNEEGKALALALLARGFVREERLSLMARQGELAARPNPAILVRPITAWAEMWAYEKGNRQNFYDDPEPDPAAVTARASERWRQQQMGWYRHYVTLLQGEYVGGLYISLWEDVPTIMGVYTSARARYHGAATAGLARVIHDSVATGKHAFCLYVKEGNPARRLYEQLGFQFIGDEETYMLNPQLQHSP
jgi:L-amino acid N-acyltransferase YncA